MKVKLEMVSKQGFYLAKAEYDGEKFIVKAGGKIKLDFSESIRGGTYALNYRKNPEYVDSNGKILKDCTFKSSSTAAQFVNGQSTNGNLAWKVEGTKESLKDYIKKNN